MRLPLTLLAAALAATAISATARAQTPVAGTVFDSVAAAHLAGAVVQLASAADRARTFSATADSAGHYRIDGVPAGTYVVGLIHPTLDVLGLDATFGAVAVRADTLQHLDLTIPNGARTRLAVCGAAVGDSAGVLVGQVRDAASEAPLNDAHVVVHWREIAIGDGRGGRLEERRASVDVRPGGYFALCGVPTDDDFTAEAAAPGHRGAQLPLHARAGAVTRRDFVLGTGDAGAAGDTARASVAGVVRRPDGHPVAGASVLVLGLDARATTDDDGRYTLGGLPPGTYALEARALGFRPARVAVDLAPRRSASADVAFGERVASLESVHVYGSRSRALRLQAEFLERMKRGGAGRFVTPQQIERRAPTYASDLLDNVPGVEVLDRGAGGAARGSSARQVWMRSLDGGGRCNPEVYVDGVAVQDGGADFDVLVSARQVMALEVYRSLATVPAQFAPTSRNGCGVILVWLKPF